MNTSHIPAAGFLRRNEHWLWLLLIVVLAVVVRVNGFTLQGYWYDELFSAHISKPDHSLSKVVELTLADVHPPLFQIVMWWSYRLFGYNEIAGRLPLPPAPESVPAHRVVCRPSQAPGRFQ